MVLKVYHNSEAYAYKDIDDTFCVIRSYGGMISLQFDVQINHPIYPYLREETRLEYDGQYFLIKGVNERSTSGICTINAELDLTGLKNKIYLSKKWKTISFKEFTDEILKDTGWSVINADMISRRTSPEAQDNTPQDLLEQSTNSTSFGTCYEYETKQRIIRCIKPENNTTPTGCYFTDELNLSEITFKGSSAGLVTRLYPIGKDGLTIASVNNGVNYIENHTYSDKVICAVWRDERYTNAQSLLDDGVVKLSALANPERSYTCKVTDLAKTNPETYGSLLNYQLYDVVTLIDRVRKIPVDHRIIETKEYPKNHTLDTVTLSTIAGRITGQITAVNNRITELDAQQLHDRTKINEIKQDIDTTVLHISESWASSENASTITQTSEGLFFDVSKVIGKSQWSTKIQQSANDIRIAWNLINRYIQLENAALNIKDNKDTVLLSLDYQGEKIFHDGKRVGKIGSNYLHGTNCRGLVFDLEAGSNFMSWSAKEDPSDDYYYFKLLYLNESTEIHYADGNTGTLGQGLHFRDKTYANGMLYLDKSHKIAQIVNNGQENGVAYSGKFSFATSSFNSVTHESDYTFYYEFQGKNMTVYSGANVQFHSNINMNGKNIMGQSDVRMKKNLAPSQINALEIINALDMYEFNWIKDDSFVPLGLMAQQLQSVAPQLVEEDSDGILQIKMTDIIYYLIKAIQELSVGNYTKAPFNENDYVKFKSTDLAPTGAGQQNNTEETIKPIKHYQDNEEEENDG